jgi:hypothetical protein
MLAYWKYTRDVAAFANKEVLITLLDQNDFHAHGDPAHMYHSSLNMDYDMIKREFSVYIMTHDQTYLTQDNVELAKSLLLADYDRIYADVMHEIRIHDYDNDEPTTITNCRVNVIINPTFMHIKVILSSFEGITVIEGLTHIVHNMKPLIMQDPDLEIFAINANMKRGRDDDEDDGYDRGRNPEYEIEEDEYPAYDVEVDDEFTYLQGMKRGKDMDIDIDMDDDDEYKYPSLKIGGYRRTQIKKRNRICQISKSRKSKSKSKKVKSKKSKSKKSKSKKSKSKKSKSKKSRK